MGAVQAEACSDCLTSCLPSSFSSVMASHLCTTGALASSCEAGGTGGSQGKEQGPGGLSVGIPEGHRLALAVAVKALCMPGAVKVKSWDSLFCGNYILASS